MEGLEALYSKLFDKYTKLKNEKESEFDKLNFDQEVKFSNCLAAADEAFQKFKSENEKLNEQVKELTEELALRPSSNELHIHYKKLLMEEKQKNKQLSEEISRLQELECEHMLSTEVTATPSVDVELDRTGDQHDDGDKGSGPSSNVQQPACCQKKIISSGGDGTDSSSIDCVFQYLIELAVGLKLSPLTQRDKIGVLAHHQSSGYSFSLTRITNSTGEVEFVYNVVSMGTFERVAPEWMKETIMFRTSMCSLFFQRISNVLNS